MRTPLLLLLALAALLVGGVVWLALGTDAPTVPAESGVEAPAAEPERPAQPLEAPELASADEAAWDDAGSERAVAALGESEAVPVLPGGADPASPRVRARGVLLDERTREPLPDYRFQLFDAAGARAAFVTDGEGKFVAGDELLAVGPLRARFLESGGRPSGGGRQEGGVVEAGELAASGAQDDAGLSRALTVLAPAGPTYRLAFEPAGMPPPETFRADLVAPVTAPGSGGRQNRSGRVRAGTPPWVRLGPLDFEASSSGRLTLQSDDGCWIGSAEVPVRPGTAPGVVEVLCAARASVELTFVDLRGQPIERADVRLEIVPIQGQPERRQGLTDARGSFRQVLLSAGPATVRARAQRFQPFECALALSAGEPLRQRIELLPLPDAGSIRGVVLSDSGTYAQRISMRLSLKDERDGPPALVEEVRWVERDGRQVGEFAFEHLPPGTWVLGVNERDWYEWEPRSAELEPPLDGFALRVHDTVAVADLSFVVQRPDGSPAPRFDLELAGGGERRTERGRDGQALLRDVPIASPLRWRVNAPGYVPIVGGADLIPGLEQVEGRARRTVTLTLERGWGEDLLVVRADNRRPLAEAQILLDGQRVAQTDARGRAFVRAAERPRSLDVRLEGWTVAARVRVDAQGRRTADPYEIRMRQPRKR